MPSGAKAQLILGQITYGLKRLRKSSISWVKLAKSIPQGLKPTLILRHLRHD